MADRTENARINLYVNNAQATAAMDGYKKQLNETRKAQKSLEVGSKEWMDKQKEMDGIQNRMMNYTKSVDKAAMSVNQLKSYSSSLIKMRNDLVPGTKAFKDLDKEINQVSLRLQTVRTGMSPLQNALRATGNVAKGVGVAMLGAFSVAAVFNGIKNAIGIMSKFEQSQANLASVLGKTKEQISGLATEAKAYGASTSFTAAQVSELQTEFAKLGFTEKEISKVTKATLALAAATKTNLADAAAVAGATVRGFGLDASETGRVTDVMASAFSKSALDMEKFRESMKLVAPIANAANIDIETSTALLGKLADAGISGSLAGTALKNLMSKLSDSSSDLSKELGFTVRSSDDLYKAFELLKTKNIDLTAATELTDERSKAAFLTLISGADSAKVLTESLRNAGGAAEKMANTQLDTLSGKMTIMGSAWEGFILSLEDGNGIFAKGLRSVVEGITSLISKVTEYTKTPLSETMEEERIKLNSLHLEITLGNTTQEKRIALINELKEKYPEHLKNINAETVTNKELAVAIKAVNDQLVNKIILQKQDEAIEKQNQEVAERKINFLEKEDALLAEIIKAEEKYNIKRQTGKDLAEVASKTLKEIRENKNPGIFGAAGLVDAMTFYIGAQKTLNYENNKGNNLLEARNELMKRLGITMEETAPSSTPANITTESGPAKADAAEIEKQKKAYDKLQADKKKALASFYDNVNALADAAWEKTLTDDAKELLALDKKYEAARAKAEEVLQIEGLSKKEKIQLQKQLDAELVALSKAHEKEITDTLKKQADAAEKIRMTERKQIEDAFLTDQQKQIKQITDHYDAIKKLKSLEAGEEIKLEELKQEAINKINESFNKKEEEASNAKIKSKLDKQMAALQMYFDYANQLAGASLDIAANLEQKELNADKKKHDTKKKNLEKQKASGLITEENYNNQVAKLEEDLDAKTKAIRLKQFKREQALRLVNIAMDTAMGIMKAISQFGPPPSPAGIVGIAMATGIGALQGAAVLSQQPPEFGEGGILDGPSHAQGGMPVINPNTGEVAAIVEGKEGIVRTSSTAANTDVINWMNANPGKRITPDVLMGASMPRFNFASASEATMLEKGGFLNNPGIRKQETMQMAASGETQSFAEMLSELRGIRTSVDNLELVISTEDLAIKLKDQERLKSANRLQ
jgi:TP901 family phage tail tape measure protein